MRVQSPRVAPRFAGNCQGVIMDLRFLVPTLLLASATVVMAADEDYRANAVTNQRPMLGLEMSPVPTNIQDREGIDAHQGVLAQSVYPDTAASHMGIQREDVVMSVNGQPISSMTDMRNEVGLTSVGDPIDVQVSRNGQILNLNSEVRPWPATIPYEKLDAAAEKRFRDWQDRRQQRLADDVARMEKDVDRLNRRLNGETEPGDHGASAERGLELAFKFTYVIDADLVKPVTVAALDPLLVTPLVLPADLPADAPWRVVASIGHETDHETGQQTAR